MISLRRDHVPGTPESSSFHQFARMRTMRTIESCNPEAVFPCDNRNATHLVVTALFFLFALVHVLSVAV